MPCYYGPVIDLTGAFDGFRALNPRPSNKVDHPVADAWRHANTELTVHLPATRTLRAVLACAVRPASPPLIPGRGR